MVSKKPNSGYLPLGQYIVGLCLSGHFHIFIPAPESAAIMLRYKWTKKDM